MAGLLAIPITVFFFETLAAFIFPARTLALISKNKNERRERIAVIVPAHNESAGILPTLNDIKPQLRPGDRLLVVADNCTDDTAAIAAAAGAEVIKRCDPAGVGKGYALHFGLKHLGADPPGIVITIDSDCRLSAGAIEEMAKACLDKRRPVQILNLMTAPDGSPINYRVAEFAWRVKNEVRPLGLKALNLPCHLMGTGMAFPWELIGSVNLASGALVEDVKLGLELARAGHPPLFCPSVSVTSHFPWSAEAAKSQRRRWEEGSIRMILNEVPRLIHDAIASRNPGLLVLALDVMVPPLSLLALLAVAVFLITGDAALFGASYVPFYVSTGSLVLLVAAVLLSWVRYGRDILPLGSAFSIIGYVLGKLPLYRQIFSTRIVSSWVRTDRGNP
jgi:glycosyltransferase involved in cell wall biosynthesis